MRRPALVAAVLLAGVACSSGGISSATSAPPTRIGTIAGGTVGTVASTTGNETVGANLPISVERVWEVLPLVYAELEIPVRLQRQQERIIGNPEFRTRRTIGGTRASRYLDCGSASGGPNADSYELTINIASQAREAEPGASRLDTRLTASAKSVTYAGAVATCHTTGALERRIAERVMELAPRGR